MANKRMRFLCILFTMFLQRNGKLMNYGLLVFVVCLASTFAGNYPHVPMGHGMHGGSYYGNQGLEGSTLHNFYPGDWSNQRIGSYQYFDSDNFPWDSNMQGVTGGNWDWSQSGGSWNQPHLNSWSNWNGNQGWNNGMNNVNGWNNNWNNGWAGTGGIGLNNGWGDNWNNNWNNGLNNNGLSGIGWGNNWNTNWNNGWNNNGLNGNGLNGNGWNSNGLGNNWNNNWNNNMNSGWTVPDGIALQSH